MRVLKPPNTVGIPCQYRCNPISGSRNHPTPLESHVSTVGHISVPLESHIRVQKSRNTVGIPYNYRLNPISESRNHPKALESHIRVPKPPKSVGIPYQGPDTTQYRCSPISVPLQSHISESRRGLWKTPLAACSPPVSAFTAHRHHRQTAVAAVHRKPLVDRGRRERRRLQRHPRRQSSRRHPVPGVHLLGVRRGRSTGELRPKVSSKRNERRGVQGCNYRWDDDAVIRRFAAFVVSKSGKRVGLVTSNYQQYNVECSISMNSQIVVFRGQQRSYIKSST